MRETELESLLATDGLPASGRIAELRRGLPKPLVELHRRILSCFASSSAPVPLDFLEREAASLGLQATEAAAALAEVDLVHIDLEARSVTVAYPFSGRPTPHEVTLRDGTHRYAMCAIDALGVPPMLGVAATIRSVDPDTAQAVMVDVDESELHWEPEALVVGIATTSTDTCGPAAQSRCPDINFHLSRLSAETYWSARGMQGTVLTLPEAARAGVLIFGDLLDGAR